MSQIILQNMVYYNVLVNRITNDLDRGQTLIVFLDLSKAFYLLDLSILQYKLSIKKMKMRYIIPLDTYDQ